MGAIIENKRLTSIISNCTVFDQLLQHISQKKLGNDTINSTTVRLPRSEYTHYPRIICVSVYFQMAFHQSLISLNLPLAKTFYKLI